MGAKTTGNRHFVCGARRFDANDDAASESSGWWRWWQPQPGGDIGGNRIRRIAAASSHGNFGVHNFWERQVEWDAKR